MFSQKRKSYIEIGEVYFWTATIRGWHKLLEATDFKEVIVSSLEYLSRTGKIDVYAFVIMPNHIHLIWKTKEMNGKEKAQSSFLKYTAHIFKQKLNERNPESLSLYKVDASNKQYEFWQRDSLAIHLYTTKVTFQKLDYLHNNPLAEHWSLAKDPCEYKYSSARFYFEGKDDFGFLKDIRDEF